MSSRLDSRSFVIAAVFIAVFGLYAFRLFYMQVVDDEYRELAGNRIQRTETIYPERGLLYDRFGKLIVFNEPIYNLMVVPGQVSTLDTARFCQLFEIEIEYFRTQYAKAKKYSYQKPSLFIKEISVTDFASAEEFLDQFPGFYPEVRTIRKYPYKSAAHILGFVGEVGSEDIDNSEGYYKSGDHIGRTGIEKVYEDVLRGDRGTKKVLIDQFNRSVGSYRDGKSDVQASRGQNLSLTIDIELQNYGEQLMRNKKGSIVAIDPKTGEILALISSPAYDPNLLVGRERSDNFKQLRQSGFDPMNNRALSGYYPPGSTFKPLMALIALQDSAISRNFYYQCNSGYRLGGLRVGCHPHTSCSSVQGAIQTSCNAYFCAAFKLFIEQPGYENAEAGFIHWRDYLSRFGLGTKLGIDLPGEIRGNVPTVAGYDKSYGKGRWKASTMITLGIGQDRLILTPLQQANMMSAIAMRGRWYIPHMVRQVEIDDDRLSMYRQANIIDFDQAHFETVVNGMFDVVEKGTGRNAQIPGIEVCGKTGTAENPHGKDHSVFVSFAPKDDPQIAICTIVENAGWGSSYAAPICGLMMEKYLNREIAPSQKWKEEKMFNANLLVEEEKTP
ncbi:MAG: penicillin-binding protein 2 [Limisphaerales bacterium]|jgi:penicillin-binding protein 2